MTRIALLWTILLIALASGASAFFHRKRPNWSKSLLAWWVLIVELPTEGLGVPAPEETQHSPGESALLGQYDWSQYMKMTSIGKMALESALLQELSNAIGKPMEDAEAKRLLEDDVDMRRILLECWKSGDLGPFWRQFVFSPIAVTVAGISNEDISSPNDATTATKDNRGIVSPAKPREVLDNGNRYSATKATVEEYLKAEEQPQMMASSDLEDDLDIGEEMDEDFLDSVAEESWSDNENLENVDDPLEPAESTILGEERPEIQFHNAETENDNHTQNIEIHGGTFINVEGNSYSSDHCRKVATWYFSLDLYSTHNDIAKKRSKDTGSWLLVSGPFNDWQTNPDCRVLWCPGDPGVGKTTIASLVIDDLRQYQDVAVGFVYFSYKRQAHQNPSMVLECLTRQMYEACQDDEGSSCLEALYREHERNQSRPSIDQLHAVLSESSGRFQQYFIILDAGDEYLSSFNAEAIRKLIQTILSIGPNVKILITSRNIDGLALLFNEFGAVMQTILADDEDMTRYLRSRIQDAGFCFEISEHLSQQIIEGVKAAADGRFLLAELHMNALAGHINPGTLEDALLDLPHDIEETYQSSLERITDYRRDHRVLAMRTLMWVACSLRPLLIEELQHALAIQTAPHRDEVDKYVTPFQMISALCAGLIIVQDGKVAFVHFTAQAFFDSPHVRSHYFGDAEEEISRVCLDYINLPRCVDIVSTLDFAGWLTQSKMSTIVFYDYASRHLGLHAEASAEDPVNLAQWLLRPDDGSVQACCAYVLASDPATSEYDSCRESSKITAPSAFLAIYYNQHAVLHTLLRPLTDEPRTLHGRTPLMLAALLDKRPALQVLLSCSEQSPDQESRGASFHEWRGYYNVFDHHERTALHYAASHGHEEATAVLLALEDINVNSSDAYGRTPLCLAAEGGHYDVVVHLLDHHAIEVDHVRNDGWTPLTGAALYGHDAVVDLLLDHDGVQVNINHTDLDGRTPISYAARYGREQVVARLLRCSDINVNLVDNDGRSPLLWAVQNGHAAVVSCLLMHDGIDVNLADGDGLTPLDWARHKGHGRIIQILLQHRSTESEDVSDDMPAHQPWARLAHVLLP